MTHRPLPPHAMDASQLLELVDTEGTEAAAQYIRETVRDWLF